MTHLMGLPLLGPPFHFSPSLSLPLGKYEPAHIPLRRGEGRRAAVGSPHRGALLIEPTSLMRGEGHPARLFLVVEGEDGVARVMVVVKEWERSEPKPNVMGLM